MTEPHPPDVGVALMLRVQSGDMEAFTELVDRYKASVLGLIQRLVKDRTLADDLGQEVFLKVFRARERYRPLSKFSTWLYRITYNCALNGIQSRERGRVVSLEGLRADGESSITFPDPRRTEPIDEIAGTELRVMVEGILDRLPANQRLAVELHKYEGLSYRDIGEALGCSEPAVKSLLARARQHIREKLGPYLREKVI